MADLDLFEGDLVRRRVQGSAAVLDRPALDELVRRDDRALVVQKLNRAVDARGVGALLRDLVTPLPQLEVLVHPALEGEVRPLCVARDLPRDRVPVVVDRLVLDDLGLGLESRDLAEDANLLVSADLEAEM